MAREPPGSCRAGEECGHSMRCQLAVNSAQPHSPWEGRDESGASQAVSRLGLTIILASGRFLPILEMWKLRFQEVTCLHRVVREGQSQTHLLPGHEEPGQGMAPAPGQGGFCPERTDAQGPASCPGFPRPRVWLVLSPWDLGPQICKLPNNKHPLKAIGDDVSFWVKRPLYYDSSLAALLRFREN